MIVDWYVDIHGLHLKNDNYMKSVIENATPFMEYFCERLSLIEDWKISDAEIVFGDIINEMPIMNFYINRSNGEEEFIIRYNKYVNIKLTDTTKQIYREIKLGKILA